MIERLREDVRAIVAKGVEEGCGRLVGSPGHAAARDHLLRRCRELGLEGYRGDFEWPYPVGDTQCVNVMACLPGSDPSLDPILLAAHYDTCGPFPGADDNAAAISILLGIVEPLRKRKLQRSVIFAFFDAEEPPHFLSPAMGSVYWYTQQRKEPVHFALVMDLCGHDVPVPGLTDLLFVTGMETDPRLDGIVQKVAGQIEIPLIPTLNRYVGDLSDHHVFRMHQRPYLFLSCGHWEHYHEPTDTPEKLNYEKMAAIAQCVLESATLAAAAELAGPFEGYDTTPTELACLRETVGPLAGALGLPLEDRADIDRIVLLMMAQYGI